MAWTTRDVRRAGRDGFNGGVVSALHILRQAGEDVLAVEIIRACGREQLARWVAREDADPDMAKYIRTVR